MAKSKELDWAAIILCVTSFGLIGVMSGMNNYLENHESLGLIDDGKVHDRIVWVPKERASEFRGHMFFDEMAPDDKQQFIVAMNKEDYDTESKLFKKYKNTLRY